MAKPYFASQRNGNIIAVLSNNNNTQTIISQSNEFETGLGRPDPSTKKFNFKDGNDGLASRGPHKARCICPHQNPCAFCFWC